MAYCLHPHMLCLLKAYAHNKNIDRNGGVPPKIAKLPTNGSQIASLFECPFTSTPPPFLYHLPTILKNVCVPTNITNVHPLILQICHNLGSESINVLNYHRVKVQTKYKIPVIYTLSNSLGILWKDLKSNNCIQKRR